MYDTSGIQAFIGQKYGYRPFPPKIPASEFTSLRDALVQEGKDVSVLDKWFKIDRNTIPSIYRLQPISSILKHYNDKVCVPSIRSQYLKHVKYDIHMYI